jgi:hypothetical protein
MRFEIRAGGGFLILVGLVGLSAGVFGLGLVAGYEMARGNTPDLNQISSTYPLPSPPEKPAPVSEMFFRFRCCVAIGSVRPGCSADQAACARDWRSISGSADVTRHGRAPEAARRNARCQPCRN